MSKGNRGNAKWETMIEESGTVTVVYDGDCPFCQAFVRMARLRKTGASVTLVDARDRTPLVLDLAKQGYDLDEGMIVRIDKRLYYGADAAHVLALLSSRAGMFNRIAFAVLRSRRLARLLYPAMRGGRNLVLRLMGRRKIFASPIEPPRSAADRT